ncbi:MAG: hypothetical protein JXD22_08530 [Sedimentisphaerales bacterium]|nr:hypothetical protein [Sedimentisphaerales bacterium]
MARELKQIECRQGMLEKDMKPEDLPVRVWCEAKIPAGMCTAINMENLLNFGGAQGDKKAGDPMEYDYLKQILTEESIDITVFNRGIALFMSDHERIRRIHRALCKLDALGKD